MFSSKALPPTFASALGVITHPAFFGIWMGLALASYWHFDEAIAFYIRENLPKPLSYQLKQISKLGIAGYYLTIFAALYCFHRFFSKRDVYVKTAAYLLSVVIIPGLFCDLLKMLLGRYRPRMLFHDGLYGFHFLTLKSKMWSFPSGHSVTFMGVMMALSLLYPRHWRIFCTVGVFICLTRVLVTAHFLSDVMVGAYIGAVGAMLCYHWMYHPGGSWLSRFTLPAAKPSVSPQES